MKKMVRIGAAVCIIAVFTSFSPVQEETKAPVETQAEPIACLK